MLLLTERYNQVLAEKEALMNQIENQSSTDNEAQDAQKIGKYLT